VKANVRSSSVKNPFYDSKMSTRIPISWLVLSFIVAIFAFFGYHIIQATSVNEIPLTKAPVLSIQKPNEEQMDYTMPDGRPSYIANAPSDDDGVVEHAENTQRAQPAPKPMPRVAGQTEEDLRAPEPLQATPPTTQYDPPEATDPMNRHVHMSAEFGSNLRHPEQMIERRPASSMNYVVPSGLGSEKSSQGGNRQVSFAPEMAQNGGEFMEGISAFDMSESGIAYAML